MIDGIYFGVRGLDKIFPQAYPQLFPQGSSMARPGVVLESHRAFNERPTRLDLKLDAAAPSDHSLL